MCITVVLLVVLQRDRAGVIWVVGSSMLSESVSGSMVGAVYSVVSGRV